MPPGVQTELIQSFQRLDGFDHRITGRAQTQYDWLLEAFLRQSHRRDEEGCALDTFPCSARLMPHPGHVEYAHGTDNGPA